MFDNIAKSTDAAIQRNCSIRKASFPSKLFVYLFILVSLDSSTCRIQSCLKNKVAVASTCTNSQKNAYAL